MAWTEIAKPSLPTLKWDDPENIWDEERLNWDESGYTDLDKPFISNFFVDHYYPFLDTGFPFRRGSYTEITKP